MSLNVDFVTNVWTYSEKIIKKDSNIVEEPANESPIKQQVDLSSTVYEASETESSGTGSSLESSSISIDDCPLFGSHQSFGEEEEPVQMFSKPIPGLHRILHSIPEGEICLSERFQVYFDVNVEEVFKD